MVHFSIISATAGILAAACLVSATPVPSDNDPKARIIPFVNKHAAARRSESYSFSETTKRDLHRIQRRNERDAALMKRSGTELLRAKNTAAALEPFDIDCHRKARTKKRQGYSTDPLVNNDDKVYYGNIDIGTPAQVITIDFDTGSSDLVVPSASCANCTGPFFDPSKSTSFATTNQPFSTSFGDDSTAYGLNSTETVAIGSLGVQTQAFAVITQASKGFDDPNSGLMGLAFPTIAETQATPWFMNLAHAGALASNVVSFYLSRQGADGSELCVGCIDSAKFTGQPEYFPLTPGDASQKTWDIQTQGFTVGGQLVPQAMTATIDSGTSLIYVPPSYATALYSKIPGAQAASDNKQFTFPCANAASLQVGIMFGSSTVFNINPTQFIAAADQATGTCTGAIMSSGQEDGIALVGDAFMSTWYSIFDYGNMRVGFAQAV
ncbi:Type I transmembrane sorting receptor [Tulasnella sp. 424]|nr:Type I transmembrane sorting receptor [Tulasnella sp. 424]KAG8973486.1 Type I transmembrane sorting receptor [Tulasnella sp. 425]